jgi:hypothetical protein
MIRIIDGPRIAAGLLALACLAIVLAAGIRALAPTPPVAPLQARTDVQADIDRLQTLFGTAGQAGQAPEVIVATDPSIRLVGVISEGDRSIALVSVDGQPARPMSTGSRLGQNAMLLQIDSDRITIQRDDGRKSVLRVPPRASSTAGVPTARGAAGAGPTRGPAAKAP